MKPLRILYLNYEYPPIGGGGGATSKFLAETLTKRGHKIYVLTGGISGALGVEHPTENLTIERLYTTRKRSDVCTKMEMIFFILHAVVVLNKRIRMFQPDLIHVFFSFPSGAVIWPYQWFYKKPYIISLLGGDVPGFLPKETDFFHKLIRPLTIHLWNGASAVVPNSRGLEILARKTLEREFTVITNGVDLSVFYPDHLESVNKLMLLFVGRLVPQKGLDLLLKALGQIQSHISCDYSLTVVGDGPHKDEYLKLAIDLNLNDKIKWMGWINLEDLPTIYRSHHLFVMPSRFEGMASVMLQAMACGCTVISSAVFGAEELVHEGKNGSLFPVGDIQQLAEKILLLSRSDHVTQMREAAISIASQFSWDEIAKQYEKQYIDGLTK